MSAHSRKISSSSAAKAVRRAACNSDPADGISLCIPRVFNNIGWRRIKQCFIDLRWGFVERVDVISLGKNKRAFVHFAPGKWNTRDPEAMQALQALQNGDEVKVLYDDGEMSCFEPFPLRPRKRPPVTGSQIDPAMAGKGLATCIVTDIYHGMEDTPRGSIKYIRVLEHVPRPWAARPR